MAQNVAQYIMRRAQAMGLDPRAVLAVAKMEGLGGGVGDSGTSFGPFQLHEGGALPKGIGNPRQWASSPAGINYALGRINSVAHGERGAQAISDIVSRFERPADPGSEIAGAERAYGGPVGASPKLGAMQALIGGGGGGGGMNPMAQMLLAEGMQALSGASTPQQQGQTLLQLALARKAMTSGGGGMGGGGGGMQSGSMPTTPYNGKFDFVGDTQGVQGGFLGKLSAAAKAAGITKIQVTSGYRSPEHNAAVGGVPHSLHTQGRAMDGNAYIPGRGWVPLGVALKSVASRYGLRSGDVPGFFNGGTDPVHVDDGS